MIDPLTPNADARALTRRAATPEDSARQFEEIFLKQFVGVMTESLFDGELAGDGALTGGGNYTDMQREALTDALTEHLAEQGTLRLADLMLRQWQAQGRTPEDASPPALKQG